jgi:peroxiredoxin Q/BCP
MNAKVKIGDRAPDFSLEDKDGRSVSLSQFLGVSDVVLFFYPKDNTLGCTREACSFRDSYENFKDLGAEVIGISSDSSSSHTEFASRHRLPFILLSDPNGRVKELYGVVRTFGLLPGRVTFVIDKEGVVRHIFSSQFRLQRHVDEAVRIVRSLNRDQNDP